MIPELVEMLGEVKAFIKPHPKQKEANKIIIDSWKIEESQMPTTGNKMKHYFDKARPQFDNPAVGLACIAHKGSPQALIMALKNAYEKPDKPNFQLMYKRYQEAEKDTFGWLCKSMTSAMNAIEFEHIILNLAQQSGHKKEDIPSIIINAKPIKEHPRKQFSHNKDRDNPPVMAWHISCHPDNVQFWKPIFTKTYGPKRTFNWPNDQHFVFVPAPYSPANDPDEAMELHEHNKKTTKIMARGDGINNNREHHPVP